MVQRFLPPPSRSTIWRIVASVALAAILWSWVTTLRDPESDRLLSNIPVSAENLASGLVITTESEEARVRVSGPESVINDIQPDDVVALVDLSAVERPGRYTVPIDIAVPDDVWRSSADPETVEVVVDESVSVEFPVAVEILGIAVGSLRTASVDPAISSIQVTGPSSVVDTIDHISLPVDVAGRIGTYEDVSVAQALDADNISVTGVTIDPAVVDLTVSVSARGKSVAILPATSGIPSAGFEVVNTTAIPATVIVDGPEELLAQVVALSAAAVNVNGATTSITESVAIRDLPEGLEILEPGSGLVDVLVQIEQRGVRQVLPGQLVIVTNVDNGLAASVSPNEISIEVVAPEEVLTSLTGDQLQVVVDASGLAAGIYSVEPSVNVPANVQWVSADPSVVELTLTREDE